MNRYTTTLAIIIAVTIALACLMASAGRASDYRGASNDPCVTMRVVHRIVITCVFSE